MAYLTSFLEAFFQIISGLIFQVWNFLRVESCCMNTIHFCLLFCIYHMDSFSLSSEMIIATTIINLQNRFWSSTHPPVFGFWLLGCESRDFSQRDKQKKRTILNENSCHLWICSALQAVLSFFLSMRNITWLNSQQPKTKAHVEDLGGVSHNYNWKYMNLKFKNLIQ